MVITLSSELQRADKGIVGFLKSLTMTDTDRANAANRSVIEYQPCAVDTDERKVVACYIGSDGVEDSYYDNEETQLGTHLIYLILKFLGFMSRM